MEQQRITGFNLRNTLLKLLILTTFISSKLVFGQKFKQTPIAFCYQQGPAFQFCTSPADQTANDTRPDMGLCCQKDSANPNNNCGVAKDCTPASWQNQNSGFNPQQVQLYGTYYPTVYRTNRANDCGTASPYIIATPTPVNRTVSLSLTKGACAYLVQANQGAYYPVGSKMQMKITAAKNSNGFISYGLERWLSTTIDDQPLTASGQPQIGVFYQVDINQGLILTAESPDKTTSGFISIELVVTLPDNVGAMERMIAGMPYMAMYAAGGGLVLLIVGIIVGVVIMMKRKKAKQVSQEGDPVNTDTEMADQSNMNDYEMNQYDSGEIPVKTKGKR